MLDPAHGPDSRIVRVSVLELVRLSYPGAVSTSGRAQDSMRRLDRVFKAGKYRGRLYPKAGGGFGLVSLCEGEQFNLSRADVARVVRP